MSGIEELLDMKLDRKLHQLTSEDFVLKQTVKQIELSCAVIKSIDYKFSEYMQKAPNPNKVEEALKLFVSYVTKDDIETLYKVFSDTAKVRKLAWALSYECEDLPPLIKSKYLKEALDIIDRNFKTSLLSPLLHAVLKNWISVDVKPIQDLILKKLKSANPNRHITRTLSSRAKYFLTNGGTTNLCEEIIRQDYPLEKMPQYVDLQQMTIYYEYFSEVIEIYVRLISNSPVFIEKIDDILSFLEQYGSKDTIKKCIEKIVLKLEKHRQTDESLKMKILNFCFRNVGDPSSDHVWMPWINANKQDVHNLKRARHVLNAWLTNKFIYVFFDKLSMDPDRRAFWNKYIDYVDNFKIYMDSMRAWEFRKKFREIDDSILKIKLGYIREYHDNHSFILKIKNYYFVEFSKVGGACYIYREENPECPDISLNKISISSLRNPRNRDLAIRTDRYDPTRLILSPEGRVLHNWSWQERFETWMRRFLRL